LTRGRPASRPAVEAYRMAFSDFSHKFFMIDTVIKRTNVAIEKIIASIGVVDILGVLGHISSLYFMYL
jgi:HJR/Mrr/RecB family endonuclease